jgi:hypothetical protein
MDYQRPQIATANGRFRLAVAGSVVRSWMLNDDVVAGLSMRYPLYSTSLMPIAGDVDDAKEAKRLMKLPYGRGASHAMASVLCDVSQSGLRRS